jgi:amino acid permease
MRPYLEKSYHKKLGRWSGSSWRPWVQALALQKKPKQTNKQKNKFKFVYDLACFCIYVYLWIYLPCMRENMCLLCFWMVLYLWLACLQILAMGPWESYLKIFCFTFFFIYKMVCTQRKLTQKKTCKLRYISKPTNNDNKWSLNWRSQEQKDKCKILIN